MPADPSLDIPSPDTTADKIGYAAAVTELEMILRELERDDVDIDVLGPQVRRAAHLIRICRDRIAATRFDVEQIVADLVDLDPTGGRDVTLTEDEPGA